MFGGTRGHVLQFGWDLDLQESNVTRNLYVLRVEFQGLFVAAKSLPIFSVEADKSRYSLCTDISVNKKIRNPTKVRNQVIAFSAHCYTRGSE